MLVGTLITSVGPTMRKKLCRCVFYKSDDDRKDDEFEFQDVLFTFQIRCDSKMSKIMGAVYRRGI